MKKNSCLKNIIIFAMAFASLVLTSCAKKNAQASDKLKVVTTIFPEYDWARNIIGDNSQNTELTLLLDNGVDLHSYQPSVQDIAKISSADIFIYVGGESDGWVEDVLRTAHNKNLVSINLLETLGDKVKEEEVVEGMECEGEEDEGEEEEPEYDEHVWLSLRNAKLLCEKIKEELCKADEKNQSTYESNFSEYAEKLDSLDEEFVSAVKGAKRKALLFGDRFPFRYFTDDYKLNYYAAFVGCSAETEASFKTIAFLSQKLNEKELDSVIKIEGSSDKIARTIIQNSERKDAAILTMDSIQSVTKKEIENGETYLSLMKKNLEVLKLALN